MRKKKTLNNWYKEFFDKWYLQFWLVQPRFKPLQIKKEIDFVKKALDLPKGAKILDLACGHGRHLLPLAKSGYRMSGLDLNKKALTILKREVKKQKAQARIIRADIRCIPWKNEFDAVINLFTSFGYLETEREDLKVLKAIAKALKQGGKFLIDINNKGWILSHYHPQGWVKIGNEILLESRSYEPKTKCNIIRMQIFNRKGKWHHILIKVRFYSLAELRKKLSAVGLKILKVYGDLDGSKYTSESKRLVVLAKKAY